MDGVKERNKCAIWWKVCWRQRKTLGVVDQHKLASFFDFDLETKFVVLDTTVLGAHFRPAGN